MILQFFYPSWSFTDVLGDLAKQEMSSELVQRAFLFAALLMGSVIGGRMKKNQLVSYTIHFKNIFKRFTGGAFIGVGSQLILGGNDSLVLFYTPLLETFALFAIGVMCLTITIGIIKLRAISS